MRRRTTEMEDYRHGERPQCSCGGVESKNAQYLPVEHVAAGTGETDKHPHENVQRKYSRRRVHSTVNAPVRTRNSKCYQSVAGCNRAAP
jgi:hypothetical protein